MLQVFVTARHAAARRVIRVVCIYKNCQCLLGSLELEPQRGLSMQYHCSSYLTCTLPDHGHIELNRWDIQSVVEHLASQPREVLQLHF